MNCLIRVIGRRGCSGWWVRLRRPVFRSVRLGSPARHPQAPEKGRPVRVIDGGRWSLPRPAATVERMSETDDIRAAARARLKARNDFHIMLVIFGVIILLLLAIWLFSTGLPTNFTG